MARNAKGGASTVFSGNLKAPVTPPHKKKRPVVTSLLPQVDADLETPPATAVSDAPLSEHSVISENEDLPSESKPVEDNTTHNNIVLDKPASTSVVDFSETENDHISNENGLLETNYTVRKEKKVSVSLNVFQPLQEYISKRSLRLGMTITDYINMLIEEDILRTGEEPELTMDPESAHRLSAYSAKTGTIYSLTQEHAIAVDDLSARYAIKRTTYINYVIQKEIIREEQCGMRLRTSKK